ncbi:unnamed protein product [Malus baccata var. baccata]
MGMGCLLSSVSASGFCCCRCGSYCPVSVAIASPSRHSVTGIRRRGNVPLALGPPPLPCSSTWTCLPVSVSQCNGRRRSSDPNNNFIANCTLGSGSGDPELQDSQSSSAVDCVGTGQDVEHVVSSEETQQQTTVGLDLELIQQVQEWAVLVSPFFFWGTSMVAMKEVLPRTGPFFVSAFRLIPAGLLLVAFASSRRRPFPSGLTAWLSIALFGLVDAACFQGFLAQGLQRTSAGLGSVIIDSQPLTVAILASLFFGESIGFLGAAGLVLGVIGLLLLEAPSLVFDGSNFSLWQSGEWWMLLAAQSMAVGTVMVRWVSKYSDPIMATGWVGDVNSLDNAYY